MFWAICLTPFAVVIGGVLSFLVPFIYYGVRGTPPEERKSGWRFRSGLAVLFTVLFVPLVCALGFFASYADSGDYWNYRGAFDYFRMPLEPPYELVMLDTLDDAAICKWQDGAAIVWGITRYEKHGPLIAGFCERRHVVPYEHAWFLFDCRSGVLSKFTDAESFSTACRRLGFTPLLAMRSIRENWNAYWRDPDRRKK
jgi:hypothetical protein